MDKTLRYLVIAFILIGSSASAQLKGVIMTHPVLSGTFSIRQTANCATTNGTNTCTLTFGSTLAAGNLDVFACGAPSSSPPVFISSVSNAGGTLITAPGASTSGYGGGRSNTGASVAYILPSTSTGGASTSVVITFNANAGGNGACYGAEAVPSANPGQVGIDNDIAWTSPTSLTSITDTSITESATNDVVFKMFMSVGPSGNPFQVPSTVSAPYATNAFLQSSGNGLGFSIAAGNPTSGSGETWTTSSATIPALGTVAFGYNPSGFVEQMYNGFDAGTAGNTPTSSTLNASAQGWNGCTWDVGNVILMKYATAASMPLLNGTGRLSDGTSVASSSGTLGVQITSNGVSQQDFIKCTTGGQSGQGSFGTNVVAALKYNDNTPASDLTTANVMEIRGQTELITAVLGGTGTARTFQLQTGEGNGTAIILSGATNTVCPCTLVLKYASASGGVAATQELDVYNSSGTLLGTSTHAGLTTTDYWTTVEFGAVDPIILPNTKIFQWDSLQISLNTTVPNM